MSLVAPNAREESGDHSLSLRVPAPAAPVRPFVIAAGVSGSALFIVIGLAFQLQMFGDGSIFSYSVAAESAWAFHWHNISGRLFSYLYAYVPAELLVAMTGNAQAGIFAYGLLHFSVPLLGLAATCLADRTPGRSIFVYDCFSTASLCPLVFGFPTEMWMAHALFWPALALCRSAPLTWAGALTVFAALWALIFTHEGALVFAATILFALLLRGPRDALLLRALGALALAMAVWIIVKTALPPDDYISAVLASAAYRFIDIWNLEQPAFIVLVAALVVYAIATALFRGVGTRAPLYAAVLCVAALIVYWLWVDKSLLTDARYELRTILLIVTPPLGLFAAIYVMLEEEWRESPFAFLAPLARAVKERVEPQILLGAMALILVVHAVETTKFVSAWSAYKNAVRALASGSESDPRLGDARFVSSKRIAPDLNRLAWNSTTPFLSVVVAPALAPTRLVVDPETGYFWLSCATARRSAEASIAIPLQARELIQKYSCLHRP